MDLFLMYLSSMFLHISSIELITLSAAWLFENIVMVLSLISLSSKFPHISSIEQIALSAAWLSEHIVMVLLLMPLSSMFYAFFVSLKLFFFVVYNVVYKHFCK